ncbi:anomalous homeobox protein isoform X3 [Turdus rufiventris]|nr:anomalous homeobox protein isoform X3 [Turdus rufiventris]
MMNEFMAMLKKNEDEYPPPIELLNLAEQLCRELESSYPRLEELVEAVTKNKNKRYFLTNIHVVKACVSVQKKEELVQLWHEIHYRRLMEKQKTDVLTALQKFRCRKRNPPPSSLCPEGLKSRNYSEQVRQQLHRFAAQVTANPNKKQREALAKDMDLRPTQVYNWFANYRRRQKSRRRDTKKRNNSHPESALASHTNEPQDKESNTPQTADGSCVGISPLKMEITLLPCEPGREQSGAPLYQPPEGSYLKMLDSSGMSSIAAQSPELCKAGTSTALYNAPSAEQPVPSGPEAGMEAGACFGSPVMPPGEAVAAANPWQRSFVTYSYESNPCLNYCLPLWWGPYSTTEVSGSVWTPGIEGVTLSIVPQGTVEASSERIIQQSDLRDEILTLRGGQLGTLESIPHSSSQTVLDEPQCPPASAPSVEESQALGQSQVQEDPPGDSSIDERYQAARLLCEFSEGRQM